MSTPEQAWIDLTKREGKVSPEEAASAFASLKPIKPELLTRGNGEWQGFDLDTGHPGGQQLVALRWAGKTFRSEDDVDPIIVYDADNKRTWSKDWGHAQLREVSFKGENTTAMIYDNHPIIDFFHYVTDDLVAGSMDAKLMKEYGTYYFYLKRLS